MGKQEPERERMSTRWSSMFCIEKRVMVSNAVAITNLKDLMDSSKFQYKGDSRMTS